MNLYKEEFQSNFEIISAYIDNECSKEEERYFLQEINSNRDFKLLYDLERTLTINFRKHFKKVIPSEDVVNKIVSSIDEETKRRKNQIVKRKHFSLFAKIFYPIAAILVLFLGYYAYSYFNNRDFVVQARDVYESINNNQTKLQYTTSNANELSELMNKSLNFKVFIPDVKGAVLIGGTVNEMNGLRVAHFVHKKNNQIIYTLQVSRNDLFGRNNFVLHKNQEQGLLNGQNWIACDKINNDCAVIWFKNDVICSSVSRIEAQEMSSILTNYK